MRSPRSVPWNRHHTSVSPERYWQGERIAQPISDHQLAGTCIIPTPVLQSRNLTVWTYRHCLDFFALSPHFVGPQTEYMFRTINIFRVYLYFVEIHWGSGWIGERSFFVNVGFWWVSLGAQISFFCVNIKGGQMNGKLVGGESFVSLAVMQVDVTNERWYWLL